MIFTPKSIETQWVKRVNEYGIAKQVFLPSGHAPEHFRVALCEDGKSTGCTSQVSVRNNLEDLFRYWGVSTTVSVEVFSFISSTAENYELLLNCHMFYFGGIWGQVLADDFMLAIRNSPLVHVLKGRVQYNEIAYLAVCGAACISGCTHMYGAPGLDLLDGVHIEYSANISAGHANMETNAQTVQITTGTAAFLLMTPTQKQAASIVVIKNAWQWGPFAEKSSASLQKIVDHKAHAWTLYKDRLPLGGYRYWHFNLCGKLRFNVDDEQHISTDAPDIVSRQSHWRSVLYCEDRHEV